MSNRARTARKSRPAARSAGAQHSSTAKPDPVALRARHDGWSPARQLAFIEALAASGCVAEAAASVGMDRSSAYKLRARPEADQMVYSGHPERAGVAFARACNRLLDEANDMPILDDAPAKIPWSTEPIADARRREGEQAIIAGSGPIYGDHSQRWRLQQARTRHHETLRREREKAGGGGVGG